MQLHENEHAHLPDFVRLNQAWIERYFVLEPVDRELFANPQAIIEQGGYILSLTEGGEVVAICALMKQANGDYELAKMAVAESWLGKGLGHQLMQAAEEKARQQGAKKITLITNSQLIPAVSMYRKHGYVTSWEGQHPEYLRGDLGMEKFL